MSKLELLKVALQNVIDNIDAGNSNLTEDQYDECLDLFHSLTHPEARISLYSACERLKISRSTLTNYADKGIIKIRTKSHGGFTEKYVLNKDIEAARKYMESVNETRGRKRKNN